MGAREENWRRKRPLHPHPSLSWQKPAGPYEEQRQYPVLEDLGYNSILEAEKSAISEAFSGDLTQSRTLALV